MAASGFVWAQGPPIHTDTPIMLGLGGRGMRTFVQVTRRGRLYDHGVRIENDDAAEVTMFRAPVVVPVNLSSERFQLGIVVPFVHAELLDSTHRSSTAGLADVQAFGKFLLYQRDRLNETFRVATKGGVKFANGNEAEAPPLGSGSTDYFATIVAGWIHGRIGLYGEAIYGFRTSSQTTDFGDSLAYNIALGFRLTPVVYETYPSPQVNAFIELNGTSTARSRRGGTALENTGGTIVFLSPGLQYVGGRRWLIEGGLQLPVVNRPNGRQLAPSWITQIGIRVLLF